MAEKNVDTINEPGVEPPQYGALHEKRGQADHKPHTELVDDANRRASVPAMNIVHNPLQVSCPSCCRCASRC
jgi:hypothetical protein